MLYLKFFTIFLGYFFICMYLVGSVVSISVKDIRTAAYVIVCDAELSN